MASIAYILTKLGFREYAITVNVEAVDVEELIEKELNRVAGDYESLKKVKLLAATQADTSRSSRSYRGTHQ